VNKPRPKRHGDFRGSVRSKSPFAVPGSGFAAIPGALAGLTRDCRLQTKSNLLGYSWFGCRCHVQEGLGCFGVDPWRTPGTLASMLFLCQHGFESLLERELKDAGLTVVETGRGWARAEPIVGDAIKLSLTELAFPQLAMTSVRELRGESVNSLAQQMADYFFESLRGERLEAAWPCVFQMVPEEVGLGRRASAVEKAFGELLKKKLSRVAKLAVLDLPRGGGVARGLFVFFADFGRVFISRDAWLGGQRRMADDESAPSRSYLKVEEAYIVLGREPQAGETVVDLGAAPGGWSYSAAKRGATVIAVDNGPLKGGALNNPAIEHRLEDAFKFQPSIGDVSGGAAAGPKVYDWLFCDLVEEPHHVMQNLVGPWLANGWCRRFVVNLKFGHVDALSLLKELRAPESLFARHARNLHIRHLYHDREEFTVVGELNS
jgi:23S rRNA (cytidine2498-2'-O)-methyltransferase